MKFDQNIMNKIIQSSIDTPDENGCIERIKILFKNNNVEVVPDNYVKKEDERLFWFEKTYGANSLEEI